MTEQVERARHDLLLASIVDIQGSVRANDAKANAALLVHGLLFAGVTTVITRLGPIYAKATAAERALGALLLGIALFSFLRSVVFLLRALSPYRNRALAEALKEEHASVFFPDLVGRAEPEVSIIRRFDTLKSRLEGVDSASAIDDQLIAEIVKLDDIHHYESRNTGFGYRELRRELAAVASFLVLVAVLALAQ